MPHRWLGTIRLFSRFLKLWDVIRDHYFMTEKHFFPLEKDLEVLVQCFSLMKPVGDIIRLAQDTSSPSGIDVFWHFVDCGLRFFAHLFHFQFLTPPTRHIVALPLHPAP